MLEQFIRHIREKNLLDTEKRYLLAISGGLDSVCLAKLLKLGGIPFAMAHCNFGLRGEESNEDEAFVRSLASEWGVEVFVNKMETKAFAAEKGISTQMAARDLRYQWFGELAKEHHMDGILVAHHADDQLETILLNLLRGTGIDGIFGMAEVRGNIIRPLLTFDRAQLEGFAAKEKLAWREDSSNAKSDYKRNFLRNEVLPLIKKFDPMALENLSQSFTRLKDGGKAFFYLYEQWLNEHLVREGDFQCLPAKVLENVPGQKSLLFYWLREFGFNASQMDDLLTSISLGESGKSFFSEGYLVNLDREYIYLGEKSKETLPTQIDKTDFGFEVGDNYYDLMVLREMDELDNNPHNAMLDRDKLKFPLLLRKWEEGDKFRPLGMRKFKKISDFLIDLKVPLIQKRKVRVLCTANGEIAWVMGYRVDDRFKLTSATNTVLYIKQK
ncbi:tRNA lysidine(34) synthetase TilS [Echinicola jeungdonensis]|uniref:tRNA(Ile)-lysidine synthase n=1 Tax=Echinicola jeungdonensis TaxID=709343 RepID=A0ABV5J7K5_9BACT|nr:tRNA lysidine(34) synthetase TilS [Echinicola jeungdonensis]MDN3669727.1 tRNA lysidine(34) synthetase TilS [Echinicola jeungdonensis]